MKIKKEKKRSSWLHLGFYGGLQRATVVIFGMLSTMILAHKAIEPADMGVWSLFLIISAFVEIVRHGLVKNSVIKFLNSGMENERSLILSSAFFLNVVITLLLTLLLLTGASTIASYLNAPRLENMLYWYGLALICLIPFSQFEWIMLAGLRFKELFWTYVVRQSVILVLQVGCVLLDIMVTLNMLVIFYAAGIFAGALSAYLFNEFKMRFDFHFNTNWIKQLWNFGKYSFGTGISNLFFRSTDSFMVSNMLSSTVLVAEQGISLRVFNLIDIPSQLIGDILFPKSSGISPDNKVKIKYFYEKSVGATLSIILPLIIIIIVFPQFPILILAGPKYLGAIPYLRLLMLVSIFLAFLKQFGTIIDSIGNPRFNFFITLGIAVINLLFCFICIRNFGFIGAAYGLLCTHLLAFIVTQVVLFRMFDIRFLNSFKYAFRFYPEIAKMLHARVFRKQII